MQKQETQIPIVGAENESKVQQRIINTEAQIMLKNVGSEGMYNRIVEYLVNLDIKFQIIQHVPTRTSQESALVRNTPLQWGAKTMLVKGKANVYLLIYRANCKISWSKLRKIEAIGKKGAMCSQTQVINLGVKPGGVPPFPKILGVQGFVDSKFLHEKMIAFNAGLQNKSIIMATIDFPIKDQLTCDFTQ